MTAHLLMVIMMVTTAVGESDGNRQTHRMEAGV